MTFFQGRGQVGSNLSIDRIDNNKTYSKDNITFCTQNFNHKKGPLYCGYHDESNRKFLKKKELIKKNDPIFKLIQNQRRRIRQALKEMKKHLNLR
jgi:hypothetical protein